jgi:hypothetical protein
MRSETLRQRAFAYLRFSEATNNPRIAARLRNRGGEYLAMAELAERAPRRLYEVVKSVPPRQRKKKARALRH